MLKIGSSWIHAASPDGTFVTADEPILTHHNPASRVYPSDSLIMLDILRFWTSEWLPGLTGSLKSNCLIDAYNYVSTEHLKFHMVDAASHHSRMVLTEASHSLPLHPSCFLEQQQGHMPHFSSSEPTLVNRKSLLLLSSNTSEIQGLLSTTSEATMLMPATKVSLSAMDSPWSPSFLKELL